MISDRAGPLRRVIAVAQAVDLPAGGTLYITAIEVWSDRVVCHAAQDLPEFLPPGPPIQEQHRPMWVLSDDVGTVFAPAGGGSSSSGSFRQSTYEFAAAIPPTARTLFVLGPGMADSQKIAVDLT